MGSGSYVALPFVQRAEDPKALISVGSVCVVLATISVGLRMFTKWKFVGKIRADDWLMVWSLMLFGVYCSCVIVGGSLVAKPDEKPLQASELALSVNLLNQGEVFYIATVMFIKISIGLFYLQIVQTPRTRYVIYTTVGVSTLWSIAMIFFAIFQCGVYTNIWDFIAKRFTNHCVSDAAALGMTYTHAFLTIITDWTFLTLPFFILRNTLMVKREKFAIGIVLAFGSISGIAAIARLPYIKILATPKSKIFDQIQNIAIWSAVEPAVGIIAGSLVTIRPLFRFIFPSASRGNGYSPMDIPELATIQTTAIDGGQETPPTGKLEAFYDSSFGSTPPATPQSYSKDGDLEAGRRPSDAATLVESPDKARGKLNKEFQFPAAPPVFAPNVLIRDPEPEAQALPLPPPAKISEPARPKSSKKKQPPKETFLFDQTVDEPERDEPLLTSIWNPPNWEPRAESPHRVAKPLLPTPSATISSVPENDEASPPLPTAPLPLTSRFQSMRVNRQNWELRDWDSRAEPIAPRQSWLEPEAADAPMAKVRKPKESMLKRHLSTKAKQNIFPSRGKSVIEPGLPLDMFFGDGADDDFSDTASSVSRQQSRRTNLSG